MCSVPEHGKSSSSSPASTSPSSPISSSSEGNRSPSPPLCSVVTAAAAAGGVAMNHLPVETEDASSSLLELAANNDLEGFKRSIERDPSTVDEIGLWYGRKKGSNQMILEHRTPLMVAATYGSVEILELILSLDAADVNRCCGSDNTTALHCAASGGSVNALDAVKVLLFAGADPNSVDANGHRPADVIIVSPKLPHVKAALEELLGSGGSATNHVGIGETPRNLRVSLGFQKPRSPPLSSSPDEDESPFFISSPKTGGKLHEVPPSTASEKERKEYPVDPSLPDIKNSIYATDEFRMFSFKVRPCSRAYSHDWTECPFVHPGENARRRDPRKYHYSCVPCPDFRKGACRRGDLCEYAHGVFECWLHPAQYRTRSCKDGASCTRRVCFFAHSSEELRPLYVSTGSAVPSPRSSASAAMEMAAAMSLLPGSPSSVSVMSPTPFTPPMSPSAANGISHSSLAWAQPNVPTLHLPGSNLQSSRLRSTLSARDIPVGDFSMLPEFDPQQLLNDFPSFSSSQNRLASSVSSRVGRSKTLTPSSLDDLFSMEMPLSPRYNSDQGAMFSPSHKTAVLNQFQQQQQQQSLLSPNNTSTIFSSAKTADLQLAPSHGSLVQASLGIMSPGRMSPRSVEPMSPINSRLAALTQREQQQQLRSLSSRELGSGLPALVSSPVNPWSKWGSPIGKLDWAVNGDELAGGGCFRRSSSFEVCSGGEEPDVSWVQSLVKEPSPDVKDKLGAPVPVGAAAASMESAGDGDDSDSNPRMDNIDHTVLGAWKKQLQLDQLAT